MWPHSSVNADQTGSAWKYWSLRINHLPDFMETTSANQEWPILTISTRGKKCTFCPNQWWSSLFMHRCNVGSRRIDPLAHGRCICNFRFVDFKLISRNISFEISLMWMSQDLAVDYAELGQVMAWCHQAISHYLSQCRPRSMSLNGVTRP